MMRDSLAEALKDAQRAQDRLRTSTLRLASAAIHDRDIALRGLGKEPASDEEILQILTRMVKQRQESARAFDDGGRPAMAEQERQEIVIINEFLPRQMDEDQVRAICRAVIDELGAAGPRDMGRCMAVLKERYAGQMDFSLASSVIKEMLK